MTRVALLAAVVLAARLAWVSTLPAPPDWDAGFHYAVSRSLASTGAPTLDAVWMHIDAPASLPAPAFTYWMPLASWSLVPGWWAGGALGARLVPPLLAVFAAWLTHRLGDRLGLPAAAVALATVAVGLGGVWARVLSSTDVYAVAAVIGAVGFLGVARGDARWSAAAGSAAALLRNDGWLLSLVLACGHGGRARLGTAIAGPATTAAWLAVAGADAVAARVAAGRATTYHQLFDGHLPVDTSGRWSAVLEHAHAVPQYLVDSTLVLGIPALAFAAVSRRDAGWVQALLVGWLVPPMVTVVLAPAVTGHGTLLRFGAFLIAPLCLAMATGAVELGRWTRDHRDYPAWLVPGLWLAGWATLSFGIGARQHAEQEAPPPCAALPDVPVLTATAIPVTAVCERRAVAAFRTNTPEEIAALVARYGVCAAWDAPETTGPQGSSPTLPPGWERLDGQIWWNPACPRPR